MANGTYGTRKPAFIKNTDVDIHYFYRPDRSSDSTDFPEFKKLDSSNLDNANTASGVNGETMVLPGMYELRLPLEEFDKAGIYTIYITPKEIYGNILDVSTLAAYPNIRGIIINANDFQTEDESIFNNGCLVGYRIEYFDDDGERTGEYRIITSNNRCEPLTVNLIDSSQKGVQYNFNMSSNLIFCTVTPSIAMSFNSSNKPYIGKTSQKIALVNTKFNPVCMEVEMVEHDAETISTMLEGKQIRNLDEATITTFDKDNGIYHQAMYGNIVNPNTSINHDYKFPNTKTIDFNEQDNLKIIEDNI